MKISPEVKALRFDHLGHGMTAAAAWFPLDGSRHWVDFTASKAGHGRRRSTWIVTATMHRKSGPDRRAQVTLRNSYRYEGVQAALDALNGRPLASTKGNVD